MQRLGKASKREQVLSNTINPDQSYAKFLNTQPQVQTAVINIETTINDLMRILRQYQTEVKDNFRSLSARVESIEKFQSSASKFKKTNNE